MKRRGATLVAFGMASGFLAGVLVARPQTTQAAPRNQYKVERTDGPFGGDPASLQDLRKQGGARIAKRWVSRDAKTEWLSGKTEWQRRIAPAFRPARCSAESSQLDQPVLLQRVREAPARRDRWLGELVDAVQVRCQHRGRANLPKAGLCRLRRCRALLLSPGVIPPRGRPFPRRQQTPDARRHRHPCPCSIPSNATSRL